MSALKRKLSSSDMPEPAKSGAADDFHEALSLLDDEPAEPASKKSKADTDAFHEALSLLEDPTTAAVNANPIPENVQCI